MPSLYGFEVVHLDPVIGEKAPDDKEVPLETARARFVAVSLDPE
jgi:hypothetical protein